MPLNGKTRSSNLNLDQQEAEAIVSEYFSYIADIGLSLSFDVDKKSDTVSKLDLGDIVEGICKRLEHSCEQLQG